MYPGPWQRPDFRIVDQTCKLQMVFRASIWVVEICGVDIYVELDLKCWGVPPLQQLDLLSGFINNTNPLQNTHAGRPRDFPHTGTPSTDPRVECFAPCSTIFFCLLLFVLFFFLFFVFLFFFVCVPGSLAKAWFSDFRPKTQTSDELSEQVLDSWRCLVSIFMSGLLWGVGVRWRFNNRI